MVTLLGYQGHRLLKASDGAEALAVAQVEQPDLIVTDILMPTMDGYEFVRQLRANPTLAQTAIIFYTAYYLEREARALAQAYGVPHVLPKPSEPDTILATVEAVLNLTPTLEVVPPAEETFDQEHLRLLTDKLAQQVAEVEATSRKLEALTEITLHLASERDPLRLLESFCHAARELMGAKYTTVSLLHEGESKLHLLLTSGLDSETTARLGSSLPRPDILTTLLTERRPYRLYNPDGKPAAAGFPSSYPPIHSLLVVPILSPIHTYGWLCLIDKVGLEEFGEEEERLAMILGALVGRVYENGHLYAELQQWAGQLEREVTERQQAQEALQRREQEFRSLTENALDIIARFDRDLRHLYVNQRIEAKTGLPPSAFIGRTNRELGLPEQIVDYWDQKLHQVFETGQTETIEFEFPTPDGSGYFEAQLVPETGLDGSVETVLVISRDITPRQQTEQALLHSIQELEMAYQQSVIYARELRTEITERRQAQDEVSAARERLQDLSRRLVELQETERRHIARELHDEIGQVLTGLKLLLGMSMRLPVEEARVNLAESQTLLNELMAKVDELSLNLRPPMLDDLGLLPTLVWHFERFTQQTHIQVIFHHLELEGRRFTPEVEMTAYRLVQEALTNVARHAGVSEVRVQLWTNHETLFLQVEDQGIGFEPHLVLAAGASSGLTGMHERAMLLGGQLTIESAPGTGATLIAQLPLHSQRKLGNKPAR